MKLEEAGGAMYRQLVNKGKKCLALVAPRYGPDQVPARYHEWFKHSAPPMVRGSSVHPHRQGHDAIIEPRPVCARILLHSRRNKKEV